MSDVFVWCRRALEELGWKTVDISQVRQGAQSSVFRVRAEHTDVTTCFALKVFDQRYVHNSPAAVDHEAHSLGVFHVALSTLDLAVECPEPVAVSATSMAYLATWADGVPLDEHLVGVRPDELQRLAILLHGAVAAFHASCNEPYADFHPGNVLVNRNGLVLIDPTIPNPAHRRDHGHFRPMSTDIGYWMHAVGSQTIGLLVRHPRLAAGRLRLTAALVRTAADASREPSAFAIESASVADAHLARLRDSLKGQLVRISGRFVVWMISRRAGTRRSALG